MKLEKFTELYRRIQEMPSILFLGQDYITEEGENPLWNGIVEAFPDALDSPSFPALWEAVESSPDESTQLAELVKDISRQIPEQPFLFPMLHLRWSMFYTSAVDGALDIVAGHGFGVSPTNDENSEPRFMNKDRHYCTFLCGTPEHLPQIVGGIARKRFDRNIRRKIAWIADAYLKTHGVLVIDDWNPRRDWVNDELMFGNLVNMPKDSVYWFGAPDSLEDLPNAKIMRDAGILHVERERFRDQLFQHAPELFEDSEDFFEEADTDSQNFLTLTLRFRHRYIPLRIRRTSVRDIDSKLCLLDDSIIDGYFSDGRIRAERFASFLTQDFTQAQGWNYFHAQDDAPSFYFQRDRDEELLQAVKTQLLIPDGSRRKPVILAGQSNSGKTMTLAHLALQLAKGIELENTDVRKYPVFFISGNMQSGAEDKMDRFFREHFSKMEKLDGERVERVIVIWDGNSLPEEKSQYQRLQKRLFERNVLVIGSCYTRPNESTDSTVISLDATLSPNENNRLDEVIESLGGDFLNLLRRVRERGGRNHARDGQTLLYILHNLFNFRFDPELRLITELTYRPEYRDVSTHLSDQFQRDAIYAEGQTTERLEQYLDNCETAMKERLKRGVAASWQMQLQILLYQWKQEGLYDEETPENTQPDIGERAKKLKAMESGIRNLNRALALAGEFGVSLPLTFLLRLLNDKNGNRYFAYGEETQRVIDVLREDSLLHFQNVTSDINGDEYYVIFRNSFEAESYICLQLGLPMGDQSTMRKVEEVRILKELINVAESESDIRKVVEVARQFGPNSKGKLSEAAPTNRDYTVYQDYWAEIAEEFKKFPDNPDSVLLYAHLMREHLARRENDLNNNEDFYAEYTNIRESLERAIERLNAEGNENSLPCLSLKIERCANLQRTLLLEFSEPQYRDSVHTILSVFYTFYYPRGGTAKRTLRSIPSSNMMLDILLNAFLCYKDYQSKRNGLASMEFQRELANRIENIDEMLSLEDWKRNSTINLLDKIRKTYQQLDNAREAMQTLEEEFRRRNSDAFLYMQARRLWQSGSIPTRLGSRDDLLKADRHFVVCDDTGELDIPPDLKEQVREDARRVRELLESKLDEIQRFQSKRCIAMLLRACWYDITGKTLLAEKQRPNLTQQQWNDVVELCKKYASYPEDDGQEMFAPAYFLLGVYEWTNGDFRTSQDWFQQARNNASGSYLNMERMILCLPRSDGTDSNGEGFPRTFQTHLKKDEESGRFRADIVRETTYQPLQDRVVGRTNLAVPNNMWQYFFGEERPRESRFNAPKDCTIRFNLHGAQIGITIEREGR